MTNEAYLGMTTFTKDFIEDRDNAGALVTNTIMPSFNQLADFSTFEHFQESKYNTEKINLQKQNILEINYHYEQNFPQLKLYGLNAWKNEEKQILELTYDQDSKIYRLCKYILKFSGDIQLNNRIEVFSRFTILDSAKFTGKGSFYLNPELSYYKSTLSYIRNTEISYLKINNVENIWFSGNIKSTKIEVTGTDLPLDRESFCTINIGAKTTLTLESEFIVNNPNCLNIIGSLFAESIQVSFAKKAETYIASQAQIIGTKEISFNGAEDILHIQYGTISTTQMTVRSNSKFHNYGTINLEGNHFGKIHDIMVGQFYNHKTGKMNINGDTNILSSIAPVNEGEISISGDLAIGAPAEITHSIMINQGKINADSGSIAITGMIGIVNDEGEIIAPKAEISLSANPQNIDQSKFVASQNGEFAIGDGSNLNIDKLFSIKDQIHIEGASTTLKDLYAKDSDVITVDVKFEQPLNVASYDGSRISIDGEGTIEQITATSNEQNLLTLPDEYMPIALNSLPLVETGSNMNIQGFIHITGRFQVNEGNIGGKQVFFVGGEQPANVGFKSLTIQPEGILAIDDNGRVSVDTLYTKNSAIMAKGQLKVNNSWKISNNVLVQGNVEAPNLMLGCDAHLILSDSLLTVEGDVFNRAMIEVLRDSIITAKNFVQIGTIKGSGSLGIKSETFVMQVIAHTLHRFAGNHQFVDTKITNQPKIDLGGVFVVEIDKLALFEGASVKANKIGIKSGDQVIIMPTVLYKKVYESWGNGYRLSEELNYLLSEFIGDNGIQIVSKSGNLLVAPNFKSNAPIIIDTQGENIINGISKVTRNDYYNQWFKRKWYGAGSTYTQEEHRTDSYPILPNFSADLHIRSLGGTTFLGLNIEGSDKSTFVIGKDGQSALAQFLPMMEVHIHSSDYNKKTRFLGIRLDKDHNYHASHIEIPILNVIQSSKGVYGYCYGKWIQVGTSIITNDNQNLIHIEATEEIHLLPAYKIEITQSYNERFSLGFVNTISPSELSIGIVGIYKKSQNNIFKQTPIQSIYRGNIHLVAPNIRTEAIDAAGGVFIVEATKWIDEPAYAKFEAQYKLTEIELGVKLGIKSLLGNFLNSVNTVEDGLHAGSPEGLINAGFAGYAGYLTGVQMLSGSLARAGAWVSLSVSQSTQSSNSITITPSVFQFTEFTATATEIDLTASQINSYNAYIEAETLNLNSASDQYKFKQQWGNLDIEVPIAGPAGAPSLNLDVGEADQYAEKHLHFVLKVTNNLKMHIGGKASIKGATISARDLDASFGELILESVKDLEKNHGKSFGIGFAAGDEAGLKSIGGGYNKGLRETVREVTSIIGTEKIKIVVAHALHLNGAMIANAERNPDGSYTDLGNLQLLVGQLFVKHIYQYDEGITFAASVDFARNQAEEKDKLGDPNNIYKTTFGIRNGDGYVRGTIGKGSINVGKTYGDELNRDINNANTEIEYKVNIDPIHMHFQGRDPVAEARAAERLNNEGVAGIIVNDLARTVEQFQDVFSDIKEKIVGVEAKEAYAEYAYYSESTEDKIEEKSLENQNDLAIQNQLESDFRKEYGDQIVDAAKTKFDVDLANRPDDSYIVNNNEIEIELPRNNVMLASNGNILSDAGPATDMSSIKLKLQIISKEEAISYGKNALKIGKYFVRIHPLVNAALNAYAIADYLYENKDAIQEHLRLKGDTVSFVENNIISAKEKVSSKQETRDISSIKVTSPVMPDPEKEPDDKFIKKLREKIDEEYLKKYENFLKKDGSGRYRCEKAESPIWEELKPYKDEFRTNGLSGKDRRYYRWDGKGDPTSGHKDIEVYDSRARNIGSIDPVNADSYRKGTMKVNDKLESILR